MTQKLSLPQRRAIDALLTARSVSDAAQQANISVRSLYRWLESPLFRAELARAEGEALDTAGRQLVSLANTALEVMAGILESPTIPAAVRLRAASTIIDSLLKWRELVTTEARLTRLEERVYGKPR